jgi:hypothetical protein
LEVTSEPNFAAKVITPGSVGSSPVLPREFFSGELEDDHPHNPGKMLIGYTLQKINIDPGSHRGWKMSFHSKMVIFRVYVNLPEYLLSG